MKLRHAIIVGVVGLISACAPPPKARVEERSVITVRQQSEEIGGQLIRFVQPGDTLHSIAFINGLDVNKVAAWNSIGDTSKLQVGQRVRLTKPIGFVANKATNITAKKQSSKAKKSNRKVVVKNRQGTTATQSKPTVAKKPVNKPTNTKAGNALRWRWPLSGKVIRQFALGRGQQGIDIQSSRGRPVLSSNAGEVVYVGNSLKGYGNLIIIKHNETFLSAYAHNDKILVKEGQKVTQSQAIGSVGLNNRRETALHFQIRRNGKPVNPVTYLPNRG